MASEELDFNDARRQVHDTRGKIDVVRLKERMADCYRQILDHLLPNGVYVGEEFQCGDVYGAPGESLKLSVRKNKMGVGEDFATGQKFGDLIDVWKAVQHEDYATAIKNIADFLGLAEHEPKVPKTKAVKSSPDIGPPVAQYNYTDAKGDIQLVVYRHEFSDADGKRKKSFRIWNAVTRKAEAPRSNRPLYNLHGIADADRVVLTEGEKAANALIAAAIPATSALCGANAPADKTDWSPLAGKHLLIWPDNDAPGLFFAQAAAKAALAAKAASVGIISIPEGKSEGWDAADASDEGMDVRALIDAATCAPVEPPPNVFLSAYSMREYLADTSPMPEDLIAPRILTPGGLAIFGGAPKVGKSDFLLCLFVHMAAGVPFLGMTPPRKLRVFVLQAEIQYHYLRERIQELRIDLTIAEAAFDNLVITPQLKLILNEVGLAAIIDLIRQKFSALPPDIIVIDPLRNVFDGGDGEANENDNNAMLFFLQKRVEALRDAINPNAGVIIAHHTSKMPKKLIEDDPFRALSGANALRGYYTSGLLLFRPDETRSERLLYFELRNGEALPLKIIDKIGGQWVELDRAQQRLVRQDYSQKLDAERRRKHDVILQVIFDEALQGRVYTSAQFAQVFENKGGLGAERTIRERLSVLASKGYIKYFQNADEYGLRKPARTKFGYVCVENMDLQTLGDLRRVLPTHYKCRSTGTPLPVENPEDWNYHDDGDAA